MTTLQEIERAIEQLPEDQFARIRDWIVERDWKAWDERIERDSAEGKLDFLLEEARLEAASKDARQL